MPVKSREASVILWRRITGKYCCISGEKLFLYERRIVLPYQKFCLQDLPDKMNIKSFLNQNKTNRGIMQALISLFSYAQSPGSSLYCSPWLWWPSRWSEGSMHTLAHPPAILFLSIRFGSCSSQQDMGNVHIFALIMSRWLCQNAIEPSDLLNTLNFCHILKINCNVPLQICLFHSLGSQLRQSNHLFLLSLSFLDSQTMWFAH